LSKKLLEIFAPDLVSPQQWVYVDLLAPIILPSLDRTKNTYYQTSPIVVARSEVDDDDDNFTNQSTTIDYVTASMVGNNISNLTTTLDLGHTETLRRKRLVDSSNFTTMSEQQTTESPVQFDEVLKNLAYLQNDPNAAIKPSTFLDFVTNERGMFYFGQINLLYYFIFFNVFLTRVFF
jgi:hypothetical protein